MGRGSPHAHMIVWLKDAPQLTTFNRDSLEYKKCIEFIDKYMTAKNTCINDESGIYKRVKYDKMLLDQNENTDNDDEKIKEFYIKNSRIDSTYQTHEHRFNCSKEDESGEKRCKYNFPWPILDQTMILEPFFAKLKNIADQDPASAELQKRKHRMANNNYKRIHAELEAIVKEQKRFRRAKMPIALIKQDEFLRMLDLSFDEYVLALRTSIYSNTVFLKRTSYDIMINPYNHDLALRHRSNMDIQFIINPHGVVTYLTSYMLKSQASMSRLLNMTLRDLEKGNVSLKEKLLRLANKFQNCSEISAQECVYHLLGMPVSYCSRNVVFVMTWRTKDRYTMLKDKRILEMMSPDSTNIYNPGLIDQYCKRPKSMEKVSLAEFASHYDFFSVARYKQMFQEAPVFPAPLIEDEDLLDDDEYDKMYDLSGVDQTEEEQEALSKEKFLKLLDGVGYVRKRKEDHAKILRYRRFEQTKHPIEFLREQLLLFLPWRNELNEIENVDYQSVYDQNLEIISKNKALFENIHMSEDEFQVLERLQQEVELREEFAHNEEVIRQKKVDDQLMGRLRDYFTEDPANMDQEDIEEEFGYHAHLQDPDFEVVAANLESGEVSRATIRVENETFMRLITSLNRFQHQFLMNVLMRAKREEQFLVFLNGGSGTGKSHIVQAIYHALTRYYDKYCNDHEANDDGSVESSRVLIAAPTGTAAFKVRGITVHMAFHLQTEGSGLNKLSEQTLKKMREEFKYTKVCIIDEVSMLSAKMLHYVDARLKQVFDSDEIFGGLSIILVGDFKQLPPIKERYVFEEPRNDPYALIATRALGCNYLWSQFKIFELSEIMRQRGDRELAQTLNRLGESNLISLSKNQVAVLDSCIRKVEDIPFEAVFLFHANKSVNEFNVAKIERMPGELFEQIARDDPRGEYSGVDVSHFRRLLSTRPKESTANLPYKIQLKRGVRYMVTVNIDVGDGLANGTVGVLREFVTITNEKDHKKYAAILWFDFKLGEIGQKARLRADAYRRMYPGIRISESWTPIFTEEAIIKMRREIKWQFVRTQFPIVEAEAITIHTSQGQTYEKVAVDISKPLTKKLRYVAFSRATERSGLYLFGKQSILTGEKFLKLSAADRQAQIDEEAEKDKCNVELKRMRKEAPFLKYFPFQSESTSFSFNEKNSFGMLYHNVEGLATNLPFICADFGTMNADILMFAECHTNPERAESIQIPGYQRLLLTGSTEFGSRTGLTLFVKQSMSDKITDLASNAANNLVDNHDCIELAYFKFKMNADSCINICFLYKHPRMNKMRAIQELEIFLRTQMQCQIGRFKKEKLLVIGDMNIDAKDSKNRAEYAMDLETRLGLWLATKSVTTDGKTALDWLMTNMDRLELDKSFKHTLYESVFSYHKPIWIYLSK